MSATNRQHARKHGTSGFRFHRTLNEQDRADVHFICTATGLGDGCSRNAIGIERVGVDEYWDGSALCLDHMDRLATGEF